MKLILESTLFFTLDNKLDKVLFNHTTSQLRTIDTKEIIENNLRRPIRNKLYIEIHRSINTQLEKYPYMILKLKSEEFRLNIVNNLNETFWNPIINQLRRYDPNSILWGDLRQPLDIQLDNRIEIPLEIQLKNIHIS